MAASAAQPAARRIRRVLKTLALLVVACAIVLAAGLAWLLGTDGGARWALSTALEPFGVHAEGISGNLLGHLQVAHVSLRQNAMTATADGADLRWQPGALWDRRVIVEAITINNLELVMTGKKSAADQPLRLPASLRLPDMLRELRVDRLQVDHLVLHSAPDATPQQYEGLLASVRADGNGYAMQLAGATPWGTASLHGTLASTRPFVLQAQFDWHGHALQEQGMSVPGIDMAGRAEGNLSTVHIAAQLSEAAPTSKVPAHGSVDMVITPFAELPVDTLHADLQAINPARLVESAPQALLRIKADLQSGGSAAAPQLAGHVLAENAAPLPWNKGGVPVQRAETDLIVNTRQVGWQRALVALAGGGSLRGEGVYQWPDPSGRAADSLPSVQGTIALQNVDALSLDTRLKKTSLSGSVQVKPDGQRLDVTARLQQAGSALQGAVDAAFSLDQHGELTLRSAALRARDASLTLRGRLALRGEQTFALKGSAQNFDPSRWVDVPQGRIDGELDVSGRLAGRWLVDAKVTNLRGQFAGMPMHGDADLAVREDDLLRIGKLDLTWGVNDLHARGEWLLGRPPAASASRAPPQSLQVNIAAPDLAAISRPFEKILPFRLTGALSAQAELTGGSAQPAGHIAVNARHLDLPGLVKADQIDATLTLEQGLQGRFEGQIDISRLGRSSQTGVADGSGDALQVNQLHASLSGSRHAHTLMLTAQLPQEQQLSIQANGVLNGDIRSGSTAHHADGSLSWSAQVTRFDLTGPLDLQLAQPFSLQLGLRSGAVETADWRGRSGILHLQQLHWAHDQLQTSGTLRDVSVMRALRWWQPDVPVGGDLRLDGQWEIAVARQVTGQVRIQRSAGDLIIDAVEMGHLQPIPLGLQNLSLAAQLGDSSAATHQQVRLSLAVQGAQLGKVDAALTTYLNQTDAGWQLPDNAPLSGTAAFRIDDMRWISQFLGGGFVLHGALSADATLAGTLAKPDYHAVFGGHDIQIAYPELGVLFPNGVLDAALDRDQFRLNSLKFSAPIKAPPHHDVLNRLDWLDQTGVIESSGTVNLNGGQGAITTVWNKFPLMQSPTGWLVATGRAQTTASTKAWELTGELTADAAYFSVPKQPAPKLSSDVVVRTSKDKPAEARTAGVQSSLDFTINTGNSFIFVGRGLDTRLDGQIRIRSKNGGPFLATGSIQTDGGTYEGYGQKLAIDRGILNFQGPVTNPGLNVRAVRRGLPVEAGVEVVGTVDRPQVHLVSEPNVPDPDKLSWMVLGRSSDQMAGSEAALLMSAASAIFGGDGGGSSGGIPGSIARSLGMGDLSIGTSSTAPDSQLPTQTVAGAINTTAPDQVFSVGKRIAPNLIVSIERSLTDASNGLKLTWQLTRQFSIIGRAGSDNAVDGLYTITFE